MRDFFLRLLLVLPLLLAPAAVLGASGKPKADGSERPTSGDGAQVPPAADHAPAGPKAEADAETPDADKADSDKADADQADAEQAKPRKITARPTAMDIIPLPSGMKTLTIRFRWALYPNSSIEVRLVPSPQPKGAEVTPIYFAKRLKGTVQEALYRCLDHPGEAGQTHSFTKDKIVYTMIGRRNSLGNQGVHVEVHPEDGTLPRTPPKALPPGARVQTHPHPQDMDAPDPNPGVAYLQLDTWAVDKETLSLDLARDEFAKPGKLYVWFLRGDQVVWEEPIRWPGYK